MKPIGCCFPMPANWPAASKHADCGSTTPRPFAADPSAGRLAGRLLAFHGGGYLLQLLDPGAGVGLLFGDRQLSAIAAEECHRPRQQSGELGLEPDEVDQVQEEPREPSNEAAELHLPDLGDRAEPRHGRHRALVEVLERFTFGRVGAFELGLDRVGGILAALDGPLRLPRNPFDGRHVADDEHVRVTGDRQIGQHS